MREADFVDKYKKGDRVTVVNNGKEYVLVYEGRTAFGHHYGGLCGGDIPASMDFLASEVVEDE